MLTNEYQDILTRIDDSVMLSDGRVQIRDKARLRGQIHRLVEASAFEKGNNQGLARYLTRLIAQELGIFPASIHSLYMARGRGEVPPSFTVPAINLRALSYEGARAVFRAAKELDAGAFIFEIARSEIGYTGQRPAEYVTNVLAAAIAEDWAGPVFIQGDHFQVSLKRFGSEPETETQAVSDLIREAIAAGFYNIDVDTSTLVDLSKPDIPTQQAVNARLSAIYTGQIRALEPAGVTISVGGEIGEVGSQNSTPAELRGYMDGYQRELAQLGAGLTGLSKISIQTGTSHGGVVLPDGSIADVSVDFDTLRELSRIARQEYGLGGAVQHGASTLPESAFGKFVEAEAVEVHLATNFQTMLFDRLPSDLKQEMYAYLDEKHAAERKPDLTADQFYYKTRKNAIGPFKRELWNMAEEKKAEIRTAWEEKFIKLFRLLGLSITRRYVDAHVHPQAVRPDRRFYLGETAAGEDVSDLAD